MNERKNFQISKYSMSFRPVSAAVDISFVVKIEKYLKERIPRLLGYEGMFAGEYSVSLVDANGEEVFGSILDYPHERFDSDLIAVKL